MKLMAYIVFLLLCLLSVNDANDMRKESFFEERISSLENKLEDCDSYVYLHGEEMKFMVALVYLTDETFFEFEYNYCCNPRYRKEHVDCLKEWYLDNKKLVLERIERVYDLLENLIPRSKTVDEMLLYMDELDSLNIDRYK